MWSGDARAETAGNVRAIGRRGESYTVDVTRKSDVDGAAAVAIKAIGGLEILVNNAGWGRFMHFAEAPQKIWGRVIAINYKGVLNSTRSVVDHVVAEGRERSSAPPQMRGGQAARARRSTRVPRER